MKIQRMVTEAKDYLGIHTSDLQIEEQSSSLSYHTDEAQTALDESV